MKIVKPDAEIKPLSAWGGPRHATRLLLPESHTIEVNIEYFGEGTGWIKSAQLEEYLHDKQKDQRVCAPEG